MYSDRTPPWTRKKFKLTPEMLSRITVAIKAKKLIIRNFNDITSSKSDAVSPANMKRVLNSKGMKFEDGHSCFITPCTLCGKDPKKMNSKLYVNKTTGNFLCPTCICSGTWDIVETKYNSKNGKEFCNLPINLELVNNYVQNIQGTTLLIRDLDLTLQTEILTNFKLQEIPVQLNVRTSTDNKKLYFPLEDSESKIVGFFILDENGDVQIGPDLNCSGILNVKSIKNKDVAIVVPHVSDFLALVNSKISASIVGLPNGLSKLPQQILPSLERYKKLVLWFGNDIVSWDSARSFSKKLGEKRCFFVRPMEKQPLPRLLSKADIKAIVEAAQPIWHKSITNFAALREDVFSDLQNMDRVEGVKWKRFPVLNKILKGHRKGELTVITGPTGSGKTTFISEYSLDLAMQGVSTLWGSFEIRNSRLARTMLHQMARIPLEDHIDQFDFYADKFEKLPVYFMTFHGQQSIKIVMEAVEHAQYVHDISHVIIDNVQFMMGITEESKHMDRFWKQDAIIAAFRTFATRKNCHVTLVIHPRKERDDDDLTTSSIFGGAKASQEADNVLIIQDKRLNSLRGKKYLQVAKNRYSGDLGVMPLEFDKESMSFGYKRKQKPSEKIPKVKCDDIPTDNQEIEPIEDRSIFQDNQPDSSMAENIVTKKSSKKVPKDVKERK